jgi:uncharacterized protein (TIGR03086 family)
MEQVRAMSSRPEALYLEGLGVVSGVVESFGPADWEQPSPCAGWRAVDVLGHLGATTGYSIDLLSGRAPGWVPHDPPGDAVEGDPRGWWRDLAEQARALTVGVDPQQIVDTPVGPRSISAGLQFPALDLFVHGWDLARSVEQPFEMPAGIIEFAHEVLDPLPPEQLRSPATFAPPVPVADDATPTAAFIAWTGRDPDWIPAPGT